MKWVLIGWLLGSMVHSEHDNEEACEGRKAMLLKKEVAQLQCIKPPVTTFTGVRNNTNLTTFCYTPNGHPRSC